MAKLFNLARVTTATTGTGTITLAGAVPGFLTFAQAGVANGDVVSYGIKDGANSEVGTGTYTAAGTTLTRTPIKSTNSDAAINLSGAAEVFITALKEDFDALAAFTPSGNIGANTVAGAIAELDSEKVAKAGDTMTGPLVLPADPTLALQAATKQYVDAQKRRDPRVSSAASGDISPDISTTDMYVRTALAATCNVNAPTGTPLQGNRLTFRFKDNGTARTIAWNAIFRTIGLTTAPGVTTPNKTTYVAVVYNADDVKWDVLAVSTEP